MSDDTVEKWSNIRIHVKWLVTIILNTQIKPITMTMWSAKITKSSLTIIQDKGVTRQ